MSLSHLHLTRSDHTFYMCLLINGTHFHTRICFFPFPSSPPLPSPAPLFSLISSGQVFKTRTLSQRERGIHDIIHVYSLSVSSRGAGGNKYSSPPAGGPARTNAGRFYRSSARYVPRRAARLLGFLGTSSSETRKRGLTRHYVLRDGDRSESMHVYARGPGLPDEILMADSLCVRISSILII
jgi:hypothetical protein